MADVDTEVSPGKVRHDPCEHGDYYTGTREALIAAGICSAEIFPELKTSKSGKVKRGYKVAGIGRFRHDKNSNEWNVYKSNGKGFGGKPEAIEPGTLEGMTFGPGDEAYLHLPGNKNHQGRVYVLTQYALHGYNDCGTGIARKGYGYLVRVEGSTDATFAPAWMLRDRPDRPAHLKLVPETVEEEDEETKCPHCGK